MADLADVLDLNNFRCAGLPGVAGDFEALPDVSHKIARPEAAEPARGEAAPGAGSSDPTAAH